MKKSIRKLLSALVLIAMLASALPISTLAEAFSSDGAAGQEDVEAAAGSPARYGIMLLNSQESERT